MIRLAWRNLARNYRRFLFLGLAIALSFMVICLIQGLVGGILNQLDERGARYYGGQVLVLAHDHDFGTDTMQTTSAIEAAIHTLGIPDADITRRTHYLGADGTVFFQGTALTMRRIIGLDWDREGPRIGQLEIVEGSTELMASGRGVLISDVVARRLKVKAGDELTVRIRQNLGRIDTAELVVSGVFREASIFGFYTAYMDRSTLNRLLSEPPDACTQVGVRPGSGQNLELFARQLRERLAQTLPVYPVLHTQADLNREKAADYQGTRYGVMSIYGFMYEIQTLIGAIRIISWAVLTMVLVVIAFGIGNTYRIFLHQRTREIGTMRAIGMQRPAVRNLILSEAFILAGLGIITGFLLGILALLLVGTLEFSTVPGLDILLVRGHIVWVLHGPTLVFDAVIVFLVTLAGAWRPARQASRLSPADALRVE